MLNALDKLLGGILVPGEIGQPARSSGTPAVFRGFIPELTALRAFGMAIVVLTHAWPWKSYPLELGFMLMDCFFVMSGFFIGGILLDSREGANYFRSFYLRRALRILPLYYLVLMPLIVILLFARESEYAAMLSTWGSPLWFVVYLGNFPTAISDSWPSALAGAFTPLWSLQIEEQFYLLFPLLVYWLRPVNLARVLVGMVVISLALRLGIYASSPQNHLASYVLLPCRMEGLALGALIALRFRAGPWTIPRKRLTLLTGIGLTITVVAAVLGGYEHDTPFNRTIGYFLSSVTAAYLVLWFTVNRGSNVTAWLRVAPLQFLGMISYGMYVLHLPVIYVLLSLYDAFDVKWEDTFRHTALALFGTLALATASWQLVESPLLRVRSKVSGVRSVRDHAAQNTVSDTSPA